MFDFGSVELQESCHNSPQSTDPQVSDLPCSTE